MTTPKPAGCTSCLHLTVAVLFLPILVVSSVGILYSQYAALFGPIGGFLIGLVGLVLGLAATIYSQRWFTWACPQGLSGVFRWLHSWRWAVNGALTTAVTICFIAFVTLCFSARFDGQMTDRAAPVFWPHEKYELISHGKITPISKLRYWTVAASASVTWHSLALVLSLVALRGFLFGERVEPKKAEGSQVTTAKTQGWSPNVDQSG
jgi:uncharacterized membrane protein